MNRIIIIEFMTGKGDGDPLSHEGNQEIIFQEKNRSDAERLTFHDKQVLSRSRGYGYRLRQEAYKRSRKLKLTRRGAVEPREGSKRPKPCVRAMSGIKYNIEKKN
jgi:hypothetical protein